MLKLSQTLECAFKLILGPNLSLLKHLRDGQTQNLSRQKTQGQMILPNPQIMNFHFPKLDLGHSSSGGSSPRFLKHPPFNPACPLSHPLRFKVFVSLPLFSSPPPFKVFQTVPSQPPSALIQPPTNLLWFKQISKG